MSNDAIIAELNELLSRLCDGEPTTEEWQRIESLLIDNPNAQEHYRRFIALDVDLAWYAAENPSTTSGLGESGERQKAYDKVERLWGHAEEGVGEIWGQCPWPTASDLQGDTKDNPPSTIPPIIIDPSPTLQSSVSSFVFSHIAAALILGIGLLIGLAWRISLPSSEGLRPDTPGNAVALAVGRITALADCQWSKQGSGVRGRGPGISKTKGLRPKTVFLGDRLLVSSGLMQITYDTGAMVILQGPCSYEIDSDRGGYLAVGKLTARIVASGQWPVASKTKQQKPEAESLTTGHRPLATALFAVRTPTATVTDLGTEFGVEVEKSGATRSHVFQGSVEVRSSNSRRLTTCGESVEILHAGESARVARGRNSKVVIIRELGNPGQFVRELSKSTKLQISQSPPSSPAPRPSPLYHLTDLGTLGGTRSRAFDVNAAGQVVGEAATPHGVLHAFLYTDGTMKDLGALHGGNSCAYGINTLGQVVGDSDFGQNDKLAFFHSNGVMKDLGTLGGSYGCAFSINNAGTVVGVSKNSDDVRHAFVYAVGKGMKDIGALGGSQMTSTAYDINDNGLVVGCSETQRGQNHAFLYSSSAGLKDLDSPKSPHSMAFDVNESGQVVGYFALSRVTRHAFLYSQASMRKLGEFGDSYQAICINNVGQVVGRGFKIVNGANQSRAFLYSGGKVIDLNLLVESVGGWTLESATAINNFGQIAGYGMTPDGNTHAFLLTPATEGRETRGDGREIN